MCIVKRAVTTQIPDHGNNNNSQGFEWESAHENRRERERGSEVNSE